MEFELSRHQHSKDKRRAFTVTALFKNVGNRAKQLEAWRILRASVAGRELLPVFVEDFETHLRELVAEEPDSAASSASVLCSASANDAGAALPFETSRAPSEGINAEDTAALETAVPTGAGPVITQDRRPRGEVFSWRLLFPNSPSCGTIDPVVPIYNLHVL